jgi:hypothetical protein
VLRLLLVAAAALALAAATAAMAMAMPPILVAAKSSNSAFAVGKKSTPVEGETAAKRVPRGTTFSFRLSEDAEVEIEIQRVKAGRRVGDDCRKPTPRSADERRCDLTVATLRRDALAGVNEMPFTGRVRGKALALGRHLAAFTASTRGGTSPSVKTAFRIVEP